MKDVRTLLSENQISVVLVGLVAGLLLPGVFRVFHPWNTLLLQIIFFLSALRVNIKDLKVYAVDWKMHILTAGFMLVVLPFAVYYPLAPFAPDWALAFMIALAAPTGMTIALIADFFGGKTSLALIIVLVTSVLAPFTIPSVVQITVGQSVPIDSIGMLRSLAEVIILPFLLAFLFQRFAPKLAARGDTVWRTTSVAVFGILIASIVSKATAGASVGTGATPLIADLNTVLMLLVVFGYLAFLIWLSFRMVFWRNAPERITIALCMVYMNFTLSLYIADRFFAAQRVVPKLVVILLLLNLLLPFFKIAAARVVAHEKQKR
ncbi:MAG: bile acid:sodium symporter [Patescibacteria group bacterium]|mgnify:CR=1 FL=1